jgi:carboxylesterase type B
MQVTVGGESAGAISCTCLLASDKANSMFNRAIIMSTMAHGVALPAAAARASQAFATSALGSSEEASGSPTTKALRALTVDTILAAQYNGSAAAKATDEVVLPLALGWSQLGMAPKHVAAAFACPVTVVGRVAPEGRQYSVISATDSFAKHVHICPVMVDGDLLTAPPLDLLAAGAAAHITVLIGSNREEQGWRSQGKRAKNEHTAPFTYGGKVSTLEEAVQRCELELIATGIGRVRVP